jgi:DNA-directed RNA polymerase specialized sigma24 family protein
VTTQAWKIQQHKDIETYFGTNHGKFRKIISTFRFTNEIQEDVIQTAFMYAIRSNTKIEKIQQFVNQSIYNSALYFKKNKFGKLQTVLDGTFVRYTNVTPETEMLKKQESVYLNRLVDNLPKQQRTAVKLGIMEDLNWQATAKKMKIAPDTAKANWRLGLKNLRRHIKTWDIPDTFDSEYYMMEEDNA